MASPSLYQPSPRFYHCAAQLGEKSFLWGGRTQNFSASGRKTLQSEIEIFDCFHETWSKKNVNGAAPPGLIAGACTVVSETLYHFGGHDGHSWYNTLHSLDTVTLDWRALHGHTQNPADQPMPKTECGLVTYTDAASLVLFAGYGVPHGPTQPGSRFVQSTNFTERGWTNELHLFNLTNGKWTSPTTSGARPPPCSHFSLTAINSHKAVMFGGLHYVQGGHVKVNDVYIIDFHSMVWTKLERPEGATWPVERTSHAATCLNYGDDHPQLLVTGGVDKKDKTISDGWVLDINTGRWRKLTLPEGTLPRWGHTVTSFPINDRVHATTFGGCPDFVMNRSDDDSPKLADTTLMEFELVKSGFGSPTNEWMLKRVKQLEKTKQKKTDHELLYLPPAAAEPGFPAQLTAMQLTLPHLYQSTTLPVYEPTFQYSPAQFPVPPTAPTLQQQYSSGGFQEMLQEQLPTIPPIEPSLPPYYAPSRPPLPAILPPGVPLDVSSTAAYHVEASTVAAPFDQPSIFSGPLHTLLTKVSATSPYTTYIDTPLQGSPLPMTASQTADIKPKVKQPSPKKEKPSLPDIKPKMELLPKKEPKGFKTEPKEEVEEDVKYKALFSDSGVDKGDLMEQLAAKNKLLAEQNAEKDQQITDQANQIADQANQIAEQAKQLTEKDKQILKYQQMYEGLMQESQVHSKQPSEQAALIHEGGMRTDVTTTEYLRGFEAVAETSFIATDSHSHTFEWQKYGLRLHIPGGKVPAEHTEYRVDIKAGFTGQFNIPDDLQLVSCVYWLSCRHKFVKPVTLEIEHCASLQDPFQSSTVKFIVARCSQAELPYQFRVLDKGTFVPKSSYGSIEVSQFSFFGIGIPKRFQSLRRYYCTHHYIQKDVNQWDVDFIITTGLEASLTAIQKRYSNLDTISGPDFEVQFEEDIISLEIPGDGLQLNGWEIRPLVPPAITKQQVDTFNPQQQGHRVPYCRLQVKLKAKSLVELEYKVGLQGAKSPFDFFTITCPPKEHVVRQARVTGGKRKQLEDSEHGGILKKRHTIAGGGTERTPSKPQLKDLMDALYHKVADKWRTVGLYLEIPKGKLSGIAEKNQRDPHNCLVEMLETWLERVHPPVTWTAIIDAVEFLGEEQLGKELRDKYTQ